MVSVDEAKAAVVAAKTAAFEAQKVFLQSLAEQWRDLASQKFRNLATELQPETTRAFGDEFPRVKAKIEAIVDEGAHRVPELFAAASDPVQLVAQVQDRKYGSSHISMKFGGYRGPIEELTQPLHEALTEFKYNPDLIKSRSAQASYSSSGFTDSDFPLPSIEVQSSYAQAIDLYGKARFALAAAEKNVATATARDLWDRS